MRYDSQHTPTRGLSSLLLALSHLRFHKSESGLVTNVPMPHGHNLTSSV
jgi:hypothetical protein